MLKPSALMIDAICVMSLLVPFMQITPCQSIELAYFVKTFPCKDAKSIKEHGLLSKASQDEANINLMDKRYSYSPCWVYTTARSNEYVKKQIERGPQRNSMDGYCMAAIDPNAFFSRNDIAVNGDQNYGKLTAENEHKDGTIYIGPMQAFADHVAQLSPNQRTTLEPCVKNVEDFWTSMKSIDIVDNEELNQLKSNPQDYLQLKQQILQQCLARNCEILFLDRIEPQHILKIWNPADDVYPEPDAVALKHLFEDTRKENINQDVQ